VDRCVAVLRTLKLRFGGNRRIRIIQNIDDLEEPQTHTWLKAALKGSKSPISPYWQNQPHIVPAQVALHHPTLGQSHPT
jgi:hypothetical protein